MAGGLRAANFVPSPRLVDQFGSSVLQWINGQGFPKSVNISRALEKRAEHEPHDADRLLSLASRFQGYGTALKPSWEPILIFKKPGGAPANLEFDAPFLYAAKASRRERTVGGQIENVHPTVKPLKVMRWLVRALAPVGGVVLDPYTGSGTTVEACLREGRRYAAMEKEPSYLRIAIDRARVVQHELAGSPP
jgi:site-specific DNA-methyltransferase (adenine-specific)